MQNKLSGYLKVHILELLIFFISLSVYISGISPAVFGGDSGDFLSAILTKGIPHPSGYPLYTLVGIIFANLPLGHTPAWRVGLESTIFASLSVVVMYMISYELVKNKYFALITSFSLAFLYPFWIYAEVAEVFSLHSFFILSISYLTIRYINSKKDKYIKLLALFCGLSLSNNLTIILLFPGVGLSILFTNFKVLKNIKLILLCVLLFVLGLLPYLYIPIAAAQNPIVNWDRAVTFKNFFNLIMRKDYGWGINATSVFKPFDALRSYFIYWSVYLSPLLLITTFLGLFYLIKRNHRTLLFYILISYFFLGPFYIIYARTPTVSLSVISVLERFYIPSVIVLLFSLPFGISAIMQFLSKIVAKKKIASIFQNIIICIFTLITAVSFITNRQKTNLSKIYTGDNIGIDVLGSLSKNSFLFVNNDEFAFNTLYLQLAYGFRTDVIIPGRNTGFDKFLKISNLNLNQDSTQYLVDRRNTIDPDHLYQGIVNLLDQGIDVYSTVPKIIVENKSGKILTIPHGLLFKFIKVNNPLPSEDKFLSEQESLWNNFHTLQLAIDFEVIPYSFTLSNIQRYYALGYQQTAEYLKFYYKDESLSENFMINARKTDPILSTYFK